jgi:predicted cupin superfamily sugar epimerase
VTGLTADDLIKRFNLVSHPEGGWFRETYRSTEIIPGDALPERFGGPRSFSTSIYFLLEQGDISALHRIKSDEMWHFYAGAPLTIHVITPIGAHRELKLGADVAASESFQDVVPTGCWFGAEISGTGPYSLVGCTVAPGFDFGDFEMGCRGALLQQFPSHAEIIRRLTKERPARGHE